MIMIGKRRGKKQKKKRKNALEETRFIKNQQQQQQQQNDICSIICRIRQELTNLYRYYLPLIVVGNILLSSLVFFQRMDQHPP